MLLPLDKESFSLTQPWALPVLRRRRLVGGPKYVSLQWNVEVLKAARRVRYGPKEALGQS